jgi:hypothetical protein
MLILSKLESALKSLSGVLRKPTRSLSAGKAEVTREEMGKATCESAGREGQASGERSAETTSGRAISQQGLAATCKDPLHKATRRRREGFGPAHGLVGARKEGVTPSEAVLDTVPAWVTPTPGKGALGTWRSWAAPRLRAGRAARTNPWANRRRKGGM